MSNILDYLSWRGDLPFTAAPFNEVDNLILSELCYLDLKNIVPTNAAAIPVRLEHAYDRFFERHPIGSTSMGFILPDAILTLADRARRTPRFRDICITAYANRIDQALQEQFSATTYLLGDGSAYVAFRGTDDTLIGWKEDFNMSFTPTVPAQADAARYLDHILTNLRCPLHLGGHSKGGNLATYAAVYVAPELRPRILDVYSNDGPGFSAALLSSEPYRAMQPKLRSIVPESSIVGMLLEHEEPYRIVKSTAKGLFQHDGFSWELVGDHFVTLDTLSGESRLVDRTLKLWLRQIDGAQRAQFVDSMYEVLSAVGARTLTELNADRKGLMASLKNLDPKTREMLLKLVLLLADEGTKSLFEKKDKRDKDGKDKEKDKDKDKDKRPTKA